jgi:DNA-binding response OmpR family regulator
MPLSGQRILLVEDEAIIAFDMESIIREANGEVVAYAGNLPMALKLTNTPGLSLAILDFRLGSQNSLPVARKLHAAGLPFVFYTGTASCISEVWPGVPILVKPANPARLISTLASLAVRPRSYAAAERRVPARLEA